MRITQNTLFMTELLHGVAEGHTIPAGMQRQYVWQEEDVLALCDSLVSMFPIGGILTWMPSRGTPKDVAKPRLGPIAPAPGPASRLILDGQNRLATLAWCLRGHDPDAELHDASEKEKTTWMNGRELVYNWHNDGFAFMEPQESRELITVPVRAAFSTGMRTFLDSWNHWAEKGHSDSDIEACAHQWDKITRGFQEARIVETCLQDATPEEARHAFLRICRNGVPMSEEDFDAALNWLPSL